MINSQFAHPDILQFPAFQIMTPVDGHMWKLGPNDSSISRGDREDTGDNEARPTEKGTGDAQGTVDDTAFGGIASISHPGGSGFDLDEEREDLDGIEIMEANDGRLGLTNTDRVPPDDWAADSGDTANPDAEP